MATDVDDPSKLNKEDVPIIVTELLQLTHLGVPLEDITWKHVTMTSDNSICLLYKENFLSANHNLVDGSKSILSVLTQPESSFSSFSSTTIASSAKINPYRPIIAIKAGEIFGIYDLNSFELIAKYRSRSYISFWTWGDHETIVIVADVDIYHWIIYDGSLPVKMFCRHPRLSDKSQIVNYTSDDNGTWMAIVGLSLYEGKVIGATQLYSLSRNFSQPLEAHAVCFTNYCFQGNANQSTVFIAASRSELTGIGKINIIELGPHQSGNSALISSCDSFQFMDSWGKYDFPVSVQTCSFGLVYILSKYGFLYVCDLETGFCIASMMICSDIVFTSVAISCTHGVMAISRNGQVLSIEIEETQICDYIKTVLKRPALADRLRHAIESALS